jgi:voltage-gated potassium channel
MTVAESAIRHKVLALSGMLGASYVGATATYMVADHKSFSDSLWWAFMTFTTVGYGDQYPHSTAGRFAGIFLVATAVFLVVPSITAVIVRTVIGDKDKFTHDEQEEVKAMLREIVQNTSQTSTVAESR